MAALPSRSHPPLSAGTKGHVSQLYQKSAIEPRAAGGAHPTVSSPATFYSIVHLISINPHGCLNSAFGSSILKVVYGIEVAERGDAIIEVIDLSMEGVAEGLTPGAFLVEYLPFLRHVPGWFPGAGFQKKLRRWRDASHAMVDIPFARAQESMVSFKLSPKT